MKKGIILTLALVLALGTTALAADLKFGGEVGYNSEVPTGPGWHSYNGRQYISYKLTFEAAIDEQTSAKLEAKGVQIDGLGPKLARPPVLFTIAEIQTKLDGLGTLSAGVNDDYGTSPFAVIETAMDGDMGINHLRGVRIPRPGISFVSEKFGAFAGRVFFNPWSEDYGPAQIAGEVTYDLPVFAGGAAGVAFSKFNTRDAVDWAFIGNVALSETLALYGEFGQVGGASELNDKSLGVRAKLGAATVVAEAFLDETWGDQYYLQASYPIKHITLSAGYMFGDGWADGFDGYYDGLFKLSAKVPF